MDMGTKVYLTEQMEKFLAGEKVDEAEGYVPPEKN
jgi:Fe-S cluster biosynthesis and repair protein YggX